MYGLFYDFETTGLPARGSRYDSPNYPHMVQLAAALVDMDSRKVIQSLDLIISPSDWTIHPDAAAIHGISQELALSCGVEEQIACNTLNELAYFSGFRCGHNQQFDSGIMSAALHRYHSEDVVARWIDGSQKCTADMATPILRIPPTPRMKGAGFFGYKRANLSEAYKHFTGKDLVGAHSAMPDVLACMEVYFAIQDLEKSRE